MTTANPSQIDLVLFQPDIPQNAGAAFRLAACLSLTAHVVEPCGFLLDDKRLRRSGMDYLDQLDLRRHASWTSLQSATEGRRKLLLTTTGDSAYTDFVFGRGDMIVLGRESAGAPSDVHDSADARLRIPLAPGARSLNVVNAAAMVCGEALRQLNAFPTG